MKTSTETRTLYRIRRRSDGLYYSSRSSGQAPWNKTGRFYTKQGLAATLSAGVGSRFKDVDIERWNATYVGLEER